MAYTQLTRKQVYEQRKSALYRERSTWIARYREITEYLLPFSGRYFASDRNMGSKTFNSIYDSTSTGALEILEAGMMAGMTSPARPWFRLATPDKELMEYAPVKWWLHETTELMRDIFNKSNTYNSLHSLYGELGAFGTGAAIFEEDFDNVIHHKVLTAGEYALATDDKERVDTLVREFDMTVAQVVEKFVMQPDGSMDWDRVSTTVKNLWNSQKSYDSWVTVVHVIEPRRDRDVRKYDAKNMRYASCYYELGQEKDNVLLRESGYRRFQAITPRWKIKGGDVYGHGPSFRALGDIKQLQQEQLRKGQAIDYQVKPPLQVPAEMRNQGVSYLPGGISYVPSMGGTPGKIQSAFDVRLELNHLLADIEDVRGRIRNCFYADLFLMISMDNRRTPATATEIAERHEEKLLMLGPVLERLHNELLSPMIDLTFARMVEAGILPPPPPELQGMELKVEFVSTLAQAQKMVGLGSLDRFLGTVGQVAANSGDPTVWDKVDKDQAIDIYADMLGVDPSVIVADDRVAFIRDERAQQMAAQQQAAAMPEAAKAAQVLANTDTGGENALTDIMSQLQGYNARV